MHFTGNRMKKWLAVTLAAVLMIPSVHIVPQSAAAETEEITLKTVREEAREGYKSNTPKSFDIELSNVTFNGGSGEDYSTDSGDRKYMNVLNNLRSGNEDQTLIFRFKTSSNGMLFGMGSQGTYDGKSTVFGIKNGQLRLHMCNTANTGHTSSQLKGNIGSGLSNGKYHTVAVSFLPSKDYAADNIRFVIDGIESWTGSGAKDWGNNWKTGLNQRDSDYACFLVGGGAYATDTSYDSEGAFTGNIDFITVINKAYTVEQLEKITEGDKDFFSSMRAAGTCYTWLFTGGTEMVADFKSSKTTRNFVGMFEEDFRSGGSYVERSRYVFNTARKGADVKYILENYDTRVAPFGTRAVGVMIGADDYMKGEGGLDEFKKDLKALIEKISADEKGSLLITPYPSLDAEKNKNIALYKAATEDVASEYNSLVVDLSSVDTTYIREDGSLTALGHQQVANAIKDALGYGNLKTSDAYTLLSDGVYTVAKKNGDSSEAEVEKVSARSDSINVIVDKTTISGSKPVLKYTLTDKYDRKFSGNAPEGATEFTVTGLKTGDTYLLEVYDASRDDHVTESYKPVTVRVGQGEEGRNTEYEDGNKSVNQKLQDLFNSDEPLVFLFMGDSITHGIVSGTNAKGYDNVPQMFAKYLYEVGREDDIVLNAGVTNATIATTLDQIDHRLRVYTRKPDVVMVMLGTNDVSYNGENTVTSGTANRGGITADQFRERYEELAEDIYQNNKETCIVLRVPCEMIVDGPHSGYIEKFNEIINVAENMRKKHPDINITVIDHRQEWLNYQANVRNDNISNTNTYGWLTDNVHPNGRGNISMFQQIIRELGLYKRTSELANYAYNLDDWTGTSDISATIAQEGTMATLNMSDLSQYTSSSPQKVDGSDETVSLKEVTLTLTDENGRTFSKTAKYDASGSVVVKDLPEGRTYTPIVTGKDAGTSKEITFASQLTKTEVSATGIKLSAMDDKTKLTKAGEFVQLIVSLEPENADSAGVTFTSSNPSVATVDENGVVTVKGKTDKDNGKTTITAVLKGSDKSAALEIEVDIPVEKSDLSSQIDDVEKNYPEETLSHYTSSSVQAFRDALNNAKNIFTDKNATQEQVNEALAKLKAAAQGLKAVQPDTPKDPDPKPGVPAQGVSKDVNGLTYKVTKSAASGGTVSLTKITKKKANVTIPDKVTIDGYVFNVTAIAENAFQNNKTVKSVTIPASIKNVGKKAFFKCKKLSRITFKGTAAPKIGKQAFKGIKGNCKVFVSKKMKAKQFKTLKKQLKKAGIGKKVKYKKK